MANQKELKALITLAGKIDPSLSKALKLAQNGTSKSASSLNKFSSLSSKVMGKVGKATLAVGASISAGIGAGIAGLGKMIQTSADTGGQIMKLKAQTGLSAEELQRLQYVSKMVGTNFESIPKAAGIMIKQMAAAQKGTKASASAFKALGIQVTNSTGQLRPQSDVFKETLLQLSKMQNQSQRNALAFQLFGRGASELFPILNAGSGQIQKLSSQADRLGLVMGESQINAMKKLEDSIDTFKFSLKGIGNQIVGGLLPKVQPFLDNLLQSLPSIMPMVTSIAGGFLGGIANLLPQIAGLGSQLLPVITQVLNIISKTAGPALIKTLQMALPMIVNIAQTALPLLSQGFNMVMSLIQPLLPPLIILVQQLLPVAAQLIKIIFAVLQPILPIIIQLVQQIMPPLLQIISAILPLLTSITPLIQFLAQLISIGLSTAIQQLMPWINWMVSNFSNLISILTQVINFIVNVFSGRWSAAWQNIGAIFRGILKYLGDGFKGFINSVISHVNGMIGGINKAGTFLGKFIGLKVNIPLIPTFANGGFTNQPSIFGEAGLEAAIPIKYKNPRSLSLLNQTSRAIGAKPAEKGTLINLKYAPVINGGNKSEIKSILDEDKEKLKALLEEILEEKGMVAFDE